MFPFSYHVAFMQLKEQSEQRRGAMLQNRTAVIIVTSRAREFLLELFNLTIILIYYSKFVMFSFKNNIQPTNPSLFFNICVVFFFTKAASLKAYCHQHIVAEQCGFLKPC